MKFLAGCTVFLSLSVLAQSAIPTTFPDGAVAATAEQLKTRLTDRVFGARMTNGDDYRFEYKSNGYFFLNTSRGFADSGKWRVEESKVCSDMQKLGSICQDMRIVNDVLYLKRSTNGEVVALQPK
jgi:hypothetical protein